MTNLIEARDLEVEFATPAGAPARALRGLTTSVGPGEIVAWVGESGCGKTTLAKACLGLLPATARIAGGELTWRGRDLSKMSEAQLCAIRGAELAWIPQEPALALNPVLPIGWQVEETLQIHGRLRRTERRARALDALRASGFTDPEPIYREAACRLSGGMRQRAAIAAAIAAEPSCILADEPTTALDASLRLHIFEAFRRLAREKGTSIVIISHDLAAVRSFADRMVVIYAGRAVEEAPAPELFRNPVHPYTRALLRCSGVGEGLEMETPIPGRPPGSAESIAGCAFAPRCERALPECYDTVPSFAPAGPAGHLAACPVVLGRGGA